MVGRYSVRVEELSWVVWACLGYLYVLNVPHTVAAQYLFGALMLLGFLWQIYKGQLSTGGWTAIFISFGLVCIICIASSMLSPYRSMAFVGLRKEIGPYFLTFILLVSQKMQPMVKRRLALLIIGTLLLAYLTRIGLALWDVVGSTARSNIYKHGSLSKFLDYFAIDSVLYLPIVLAFLLFSNANAVYKLILSLALVIGGAIIIYSGVRTAFFITTILTITAFALKYWRKKLFWLGIVSLVIFGGYFAQNNKDDVSVQRYVTLLNGSAYSTQNGPQAGMMGGRYPIWGAMVELEGRRPWLGFGLGWKKLPLVAEDLGLMAEWNQKAYDPWYRSIVDYFSFGQGSVNPHNLVLLIVFEVGFIGLACFSTMFALIIARASVIIRNRTDMSWIGMAALFFVAAYMMLGITNATWFTGAWLALAIALDLLGAASTEDGSNAL